MGKNIKIQRTYRLMLMRDDCYVCSLKISRFKIRLGLILILLLLVASGLSVYGTFYYHDKYRTYAERQAGLKIELDSMKLDLDRIATITKDEDSTVTISVNTVATTSQTSNAQGDDSTVSGTAPDIPSPDDVRRMLGQEESPTPPNSDSNADVTLKTTENHALLASGFKTTYNGKNQIRISFTLKNETGKALLQGHCELSVIDKNRKSYQVFSLADKRLPFSIRSMKLMKEDFLVPDGVTAEDITAIIVTASAKDMEPYVINFSVDYN